MQGILFKPWKQRAIRESPLDRLWQTRRLDHLKEINKEPDGWAFTKHGTDFKGNMEFEFRRMDTRGILLDPWLIKPRYRVGETVYIKEAWFVGKQYDALSPAGLWHHPPAGFMSPFSEIAEKEYGRVRSPLHLPAWAARTFIKITDVRPERLQSITEEDAIAEGTILKAVNVKDNLVDEPSYINAFAMLWDSINGKTYPFDGNYWCFVYTFEKVDR